MEFIKKYKEDKNIIETELTDDQKEELKKRITEGIKDLEDLIKREKKILPVKPLIYDLQSFQRKSREVLKQSKNKLPAGKDETIHRKTR